MAAMIASEYDYDPIEWTRPEGYVQPRVEMSDLYEEGFERYLISIEAARQVWDSSPQQKMSL